jgi:5-methylthioribose kinase
MNTLAQYTRGGGGWTVDKYADYVAMTVASLPQRLAGVSAVAAVVGDRPEAWDVKEVGDGNLNLVFIVTGDRGAVIVKQALPYVRLVGDSWPLPLYRAFFEYQALVRQDQRDPGRVPRVLHFDDRQAMMAMEYLTPHIVLRRKLINGERVENLGLDIGRFCARTAFRGSEFSLPSARKKADVALFAGNVAIPAITEALVFTDPYFNAAMNRHTPGLDPVVQDLRADVALKSRVQKMLMRFASNTETMVHGDLHSGSIMATADECRVIDPEFAQYGPMGFDLGMLIANYMMAYFSQPAHRGADLASYQHWLLSVIEDTFEAFDAEFRHLWMTERSGMLFPKSLFEEQGQDSAAGCSDILRDIRLDALTICGIEMHRRCLSLAHNADFEEIADPTVRAPLEARNLMMGRDMILSPERFVDTSSVLRQMRDTNERAIL